MSKERKTCKTIQQVADYILLILHVYFAYIFMVEIQQLWIAHSIFISNKKRLHLYFSVYLNRIGYLSYFLFYFFFKFLRAFTFL